MNLVTLAPSDAESSGNDSESTANDVNEKYIFSWPKTKPLVLKPREPSTRKKTPKVIKSMISRKHMKVRNQTLKLRKVRFNSTLEFIPAYKRTQLEPEQLERVNLAKRIMMSTIEQLRI
jgi:hypothetical protein